MVYPKNNTEAILYEIWKMLKTIAALTANGGGAGTGNYDYLTQFTVGVTAGAPADGSTEYINPDVTGDIKVHKNGTGYLTEGVHYDLLVGGGIKLIGGSVFSNDEVYTIFKVNS